MSMIRKTQYEHQSGLVGIQNKHLTQTLPHKGKLQRMTTDGQNINYAFY